MYLINDELNMYNCFYRLHTNEYSYQKIDLQIMCVK